MMPFTETGVLGPDGALWLAPILGFAFGFLLERAGLAHAPRLAGQFYFTDFTVFKVMFTALVTAMLGAFWLNRVGLLDINLVYVPETFALPQAIGGVLFGAGFLVSGLCPGTSCVAAATGRWDGLAVVGGILVGVFAFNAAFDLLNPVYSATAMGPITLAQLAGVSTGTVVCAVTALALGGFFVFGRMRRSDSAAETGSTRNRALIAAATTLALAAVLFDVRSPAAASSLSAAGTATVGTGITATGAATATAGTPAANGAPSDRDYISALDLGEHIAQGDPALRVIDLRDESAYTQLHIPGAAHATVADLATTAFPNDATVVLYDDTGLTAAQGQALLRQHGHASVLVLREGLYEWIARVQEPRLASDPTFAEREAFERGAKLSRFFGGVPKAGVTRAEVPKGYWTGAAPNADVRARSREAIEALRRRGC